ncbi:hypothetical protein CW304_29740 [Bacillus sp. UFRGS-B20]|nr:hypothetical protein CW304_29740 [Bacillus sp. UFRGS-B20]
MNFFIFNWTCLSSHILSIIFCCHHISQFCSPSASKVFFEQSVLTFRHAPYHFAFLWPCSARHNQYHAAFFKFHRYTHHPFNDFQAYF